MGLPLPSNRGNIEPPFLPSFSKRSGIDGPRNRVAGYNSQPPMLLPAPVALTAVSTGEGSVPLMAFDRDGEAYVFLSLDAAHGELEAIDVADGEYELFTLDGRLVQPSSVNTRRGEFDLDITDRHDLVRLQTLVEQAHRRLRLTSDPRDLVAVANEVLAREWRERRSWWPQWLHRWRYREGPPQIGRAPS